MPLTPYRRNFLTLAAFCLAALPGLAQVTSRTASATEAPGSRVARTQTSETYVIRAMDALQFRIVGELETATEVRVSGDGIVSLPYIGSVRLAGLTVEQARKHLFELYDADWYVNPQIDLIVVAYAERRVRVLGKVARQGFVIFPPEEEMTLMGAIAGAGGWSPDNLARRTAIVQIGRAHV